jgi:hypothetical protein
MLGKFSYYRDDWYYMYDGLVGGGGIFVEMFRHLRPARGPLYEFLFGLFGHQPNSLSYFALFYSFERRAGSVMAFPHPMAQTAECHLFDGIAFFDLSRISMVDTGV